MNRENNLVGLLPARRLLTESLDRVIVDFMITNVAAMALSSTLLDAYEALNANLRLKIEVPDTT